MIKRLSLAALALVLAVPMSGCIATKIVTVPVKAVAAGIDAVTTSQREADERRGRLARKRDKACKKHPDRC